MKRLCKILVFALLFSAIARSESYGQAVADSVCRESVVNFVEQLQRAYHTYDIGFLEKVYDVSAKTVLKVGETAMLLEPAQDSPQLRDHSRFITHAFKNSTQPPKAAVEDVQMVRHPDDIEFENFYMISFVVNVECGNYQDIMPFYMVWKFLDEHKIHVLFRAAQESLFLEDFEF